MKCSKTHSKCDCHSSIYTLEVSYLWYLDPISGIAIIVVIIIETTTTTTTIALNSLISSQILFGIRKRCHIGMERRISGALLDYFVVEVLLVPH